MTIGWHQRQNFFGACKKTNGVKMWERAENTINEMRDQEKWTRAEHFVKEWLIGWSSRESLLSITLLFLQFHLILSVIKLFFFLTCSLSLAPSLSHSLHSIRMSTEWMQLSNFSISPSLVPFFLFYIPVTMRNSACVKFPPSGTNIQKQNRSEWRSVCFHALHDPLLFSMSPAAFRLWWAFVPGP